MGSAIVEKDEYYITYLKICPFCKSTVPGPHFDCPMTDALVEEMKRNLDVKSEKQSL